MSDNVFRILVLGDFGSAIPPVSARPALIDRDNFDEVFANFAPALRLGDSVIPFEELDDLHPDRLYDHLSVFQAEAPEPEPEPEPSGRTAHVERPDLESLISTGGSGGLLDAMVEETASRPPVDPLLAFASRAAEPYLERKADPAQRAAAERRAADAATRMRALLHYPPFQSIEAAWRALYFLTREIETGPDLKVCVLQMSRADLEADLLAAESLRKTILYRILIQETLHTPGGQPWWLVIGNYEFGPTGNDLNLLARIALLAHEARAPFLAAGSPAIADLSPEQLESWDELRGLPEASSIGLALPRFLLRLPYGPDTSPLERLPKFEEISGRPKHADYLWGNPAFACASLIANSWTEGSQKLDLTGLPLHIYQDDGESVAKPCAEVLLTQESAETLLSLGLIPLLSYKNGDRVRVGGMRSIANPPAPLAGRW